MIKNLQNSLKKLAKTKIFTRSKNPLVGSLDFFDIRKAFAILALLLLPFLMVPATASAGLRDQLNEINKKLSGVKDQLSDIRTTESTLQGQVSAFNTQIGAIEYKIQLTNQKISLLQSQILETEKEMKQAEKDLAIARKQLSEVMRVMYEDGQLSSLEVMAKSSSFSEYVNRAEYMEQMQLKIKSNADKVVAIKNKLEEQKKQLEKDKKEALELKSEQQEERAGLAEQRSTKADLLAATRGDEAQYQALVKDLQRQQDRIESEIWSNSNSGNYVSLGRVKKGDIIGYQGNTGYSSGPHLHFEIRKPSYAAQNPVSYIGDGFWSHPLPNSRLTCGYGCYAGHKGVDYAKYLGAPIKASADGEIIARITGKKNTYSLYNSCLVNTRYNYDYCSKYFIYGNYVKILHDNGWYTLYAHLR